jgi:hypothetical protein
MDIFNDDKGILPSRINWRKVQFKKVIADSDKISLAFKVIVDGEIVGAIGKIKDNSISRLKDWVWVVPGESFRTVSPRRVTFTRKWAAAHLLSQDTYAI